MFSTGDALERGHRVALAVVGPGIPWYPPSPSSDICSCCGDPHTGCYSGTHTLPCTLASTHGLLQWHPHPTPYYTEKIPTGYLQKIPKFSVPGFRECHCLFLFFFFFFFLTVLYAVSIPSMLRCTVCGTVHVVQVRAYTRQSLWHGQQRAPGMVYPTVAHTLGRERAFNLERYTCLLVLVLVLVLTWFRHWC